MKIKVNKDSEFFIALCKDGAHSYVTLGVKTDDGIHLLASIGKYFYRDKKSYFLTPYISFAFGQIPAFIKNDKVIPFQKFDGTWFTPAKKEVPYKAYSIDYQQYVDFLHYLKAVAKEQSQRLNDELPILAYCPKEQNKEKKTVKLIWNTVSVLQGKEDEEPNPADKKITIIGNSCQDTAINLTQKATNAAPLGKGVSSMFFKRPPLKTTFNNGKVTPWRHFYMLPQPPTSFTNLSNENKRVLDTLYRRMDEILLSGQENELTIHKFEGLKTLYLSLAPLSQRKSILDVIEAIFEWEEVHQDLISAHRKNHWISFATATENMFKKFHKEFDPLRVKKEEEETEKSYSS